METRDHLENRETTQRRRKEKNIDGKKKQDASTFSNNKKN